MRFGIMRRYRSISNEMFHRWSEETLHTTLIDLSFRISNLYAKAGPWELVGNLSLFIDGYT